MKISVCWLRRDLRLEDNSALYHALLSGYPVLPVFIFDSDITAELDRSDKRLIFIYNTIKELKQNLESLNSDLMIFHGRPVEIFSQLFQEYEIAGVYAGIDYEPYSITRDLEVKELCKGHGALFQEYNDHVVLTPTSILKPDGKPYGVFTPYSKSWMQRFKSDIENNYPSETLLDKTLKLSAVTLPSPEELGIHWRPVVFPGSVPAVGIIENYDKTRDFPGLDKTSHLGLHLRFGTISVRRLARSAYYLNHTFLNELIWREFYQMILFYHPRVVTRSFKPVYDNMQWLNKPGDFAAWCEGRTGYPIVDAGMHQLVQTGFMHNRVRMITASFLTKHLLIDWRWGEAFFAQHLLDYELASNNGGWQWAAGSGCDAAPYFRVFSPARQQESYDPDGTYLRKWLPGYSAAKPYIRPIIEHSFARERAISIFASLNRS